MTHRILVVDDSLTFRRGVAAQLERDGYDVLEARSGREAIEQLRAHRVDCILLDMLMPDLGGEETCQRIKAQEEWRETPVVMLTGREDEAAISESFAAGADDFVEKSGDLSALKARIRAQIRRKEAEEETRSIRETLVRSEIEARAKQQLAEELERRVTQRTEELRMANAELEAFSYSVSHDLRAPLRAIDGFSQVVLDQYAGSLDPQASRYLERVRAASQRMSHLIDDLLALSRVTRAELVHRHVDLSTLVMETLDELRRRHPERRVETSVARTAEATCDARLVRIALDNLLGNAWKFTSKTENAQIEFGIENDPRGTVFFVKDNGAGFDMKYASKLFAPFQRLHEETDFEGTGIGLATVQRIVHRHGGTLWAESKPGAGATFRFTLGARANE